MNLVIKDTHNRYYCNSYMRNIAGGNPIISFLDFFDIYAQYANGKKCVGYSSYDLQQGIDEIQKFILGAPRVNNQLILYFELQFDIVDNRINNIIKASSKKLSASDAGNIIVEIKIPAKFSLFYLSSIFDENSNEEYLLPHGIKVEFIEKTPKYYRIFALPVVD